MKIRNVFPLALSLLFLSCTSTKKFTIYTDPPGANVCINGKKVEGKTPLTLEIEQGKDLGIVVDKPGYAVASKTVTTQTSWWKAILWTKNDPKAQYIEEDDVHIRMKVIPSASSYVPTKLPAFQGESGNSRAGAKNMGVEPPSLRALPEF